MVDMDVATHHCLGQVEVLGLECGQRILELAMHKIAHFQDQPLQVGKLPIEPLECMTLDKRMHEKSSGN